MKSSFANAGVPIKGKASTVMIIIAPAARGMKSGQERNLDVRSVFTIH
jgi:hypothetical protein